MQVDQVEQRTLLCVVMGSVECGQVAAAGAGVQLLPPGWVAPTQVGAERRARQVVRAESRQATRRADGGAGRSTRPSGIARLEHGSLGVRLDAQLTVERLAAGTELGQRGGPIAGTGMQAHGRGESAPAADRRRQRGGPIRSSTPTDRPVHRPR